MELSVLAEKLFCTMCNTRLHFADTLDETKQGLCSLLTIQCTNSACKAWNKIPTGTRDEKGGFEVHLKLIMKTSPCNEHPLTPHFYIEKVGFTRVYIFFLFLLQNIDCGYSLEPPR